jgi:general secretion pathway protein L
MNILSIDIGSYSIKFLTTDIEGKKLVYNNHKEIIIEQAKKQYSDELSFQSIQFNIVRDFLKNNPPEGRVIFQLDESNIISRYINVPNNNRKEAEAMLMFQLDEDIPFSTGNAHICKNMLKKQNSYEAILNIAKLDDFDSTYQELNSLGIIPNILTTEILAVNSYIENQNYADSFCILDLGHTTTKAYFVHKNKVVSNHISHIAGAVINDVIAQTYQISEPDAVIYKHENCFFLTEAQYDQVHKDQQEFALLMKQIFTPLINDIRRWEMGFRMKNGAQLEAFYIVGGTSQIRNLTQFLSQNLGTPVEFWDNFSDVTDKEFNLNDKAQASFAITKTMASAQLNKQPLPSFLTGVYSNISSENIPLHSTAFVNFRIYAVALIIIISLILEKRALNFSNLQIDKRIVKLLKSPSLGISTAKRKLYRRKPEVILKFFKKKNQLMVQEVNTIMSSAKVNATSSLAELSKVLDSNKNIDLISFISENGLATARFQGKTSGEAATLKNFIQSSVLNVKDLKYEKGSKILTFSIIQD